MIQKLIELKEDVESLKTPNSLTDFGNSQELEGIAEKIEITLKNIYSENPSMQIKKEIIENFFCPSENPYPKNILEDKKKSWDSGRKRLICVLDNRIEDLKQREIIRNESNVFINENLITQIEHLNSPQYDTKKLLKFLYEINTNFKLENLLATILLLRAVLNYIPPIFGHSTFNQVVSQSERSLKEIFTPLENGLRKIADLHTHREISKTENLPTISSITPYQPPFEILIQEVIKKIK